MKNPSTYFRARTKVIQLWIASAMPDVDGEYRGFNIRLIRNGFIPEKLQQQFETEIKITEKEMSAGPLDFVELTSFNTWFAMHPEKIAGKEFASTSVHFPIMLKGNREQIIETVRAGIKTHRRIARLSEAGDLLDKLKELKGGDYGILGNRKGK